MYSSDVLHVQCEPPVSVAESFEDCRGLRGTVAGGEGSMALWQVGCDPLWVREHSGGKTSALRE